METEAAAEMQDRQQKQRGWGGTVGGRRGEPRPPPLVCVSVRDEEIGRNNNNIKGKTLLIPLSVTMTDASLAAQWLSERLTAAGYAIIVVLALFGSRGATQSYTPEPRGRRTLLVVETYCVGGGSEGKKGNLVKIVRKCNE